MIQWDDRGRWHREESRSSEHTHSVKVGEYRGRVITDADGCFRQLTFSRSEGGSGATFRSEEELTEFLTMMSRLVDIDAYIEEWPEDDSE